MNYTIRSDTTPNNITSSYQMDCCEMFLFFCLFFIHIVNGAPADPPEDLNNYIVSHNMLYVNDEGRDRNNFGVREPVGCLCPTTGLFGKTGFQKQCTKAHDSPGKKIKYIKIGSGACHVGKKQFFGCGIWGYGLNPLGCCDRPDGTYFPPSSINKYYYKPEAVQTIVTCAPGTYEFKMDPQKAGEDISRREDLLKGVTHADKPPRNPVKDRTRHESGSSSSGPAAEELEAS